MVRRLKFSAPDWCFFRGQTDPAAYYRRLRKIGVGAVEMVDPVRWPAARAAGLEILNLVAPGMQKGLNRIEHHPELLPQIREQIAIAGKNGIPQVIIFSGNRAGQPDAEGLRNCAAAIGELLPVAEAAGVTLVFEMLNSHDHKDYQADRGAYGFNLARGLGSPRLKLVYDIYHMTQMGDDVLKDILGNLDLIVHLHVAALAGRMSPVRDRQIDYGRIVPKVRAAGYAGYWGMEFLPQGDALDEIREALILFNSYC